MKQSTKGSLRDQAEKALLPTIKNRPTDPRPEDELRRAQSLEREFDILQSVMNGAGNSHLVYLDRNFNFIRVNETYARTCGHKPADMIGKNHFALYPHAENEAIFARVRDTGEPIEIHDKPFIFPDQPERGVTYWDWTLTPVKRGSHVQGLVFSLHETTDRKRAEEKLKHQAKLLEYAPVLVRNMKDEIILWNSGMKDMYGFADSEALGKIPNDLLQTVHPRPLQEIRHLLLKTGEWKGELRHIKKDGSSIIVTSLQILHFDESGNPSAIIEVNQDISELKRIESSLREREERFRSAFDKGAVPMAMTALDSRLMFVNAAFGKMLGYSESELAGMSFYKITHPEDISANKIGIDAVTSGDQDFFRMEKRYIHKDGRIVWVDMSTASVRDEKGKPLYIVTYAQDITERKRADEALRKSQSMLARAEEIANIGSWEWHIKSGELTWSDNTYRLIGERPGEFFPTPESAFERIHPDYRYIVSRAGERALSGEEKQYNVEYQITMPDSTMRWVQQLGEVVFNDKGQPISMIGSAMDITDRKRAEEAQQKYKLELEDKVRERTAQTTSINKSLMAEIEERKRSEERLRSAQKKLRAMASEILFSDERTRQHFAADLHDTVVQTLGAAKLRSQLIESGISPEAKPIYTEIQDMISQSITQSRLIMTEMSPPILYELGFLPALEWLTEQIESQHDLAITFDISSHGPQPLIHEIKVLLFQATRELLMNVVKHAKSESAVVKFSGNDNKIRLEVIDTGKGFDKKQAFRTDVSSGGFGLFSIRERLRHFGGELKIWTKPGEGTRVVITAPRSIEE